ncbi:alpha/beta fold hydrolase [Leptolyngbya sp. AN02str]|uniref:alpha/beta fold hydrolase n=1 Tax=Leptolyngbya sp. AN02str TaxID=3423363 RepID=UPI003D3233C4
MEAISNSHNLLTEPTSIALVEAIKRTSVTIAWDRPMRRPWLGTPALRRSDANTTPEIPGNPAIASLTTTYVRQGTGDAPILLLHGFDSSVMEFRRLLPLLAPHRETWAVDLLGFGFTERSPHVPITPATIDTHLFAFWQQSIGKPVILVGASMGGAAAIAFALAHPEAVQQLVLLDSAGYSVGPSMGRLVIQPVGQLATQFLRSPKVRQNIAVKAYYNPELASADAATCAALHLREPGWQQALISFTQCGGYRSCKQQLAQLSLPTLILWGKQDRILGTADAAKFQRAIANSQLIWVDECGHVPHLEQPQQTADHILAFIQTLAPQSSTSQPSNL